MALDRALAKDSNARFKTMEEFASAVSGERSGTTTIVSKPVKDGHGAGVFVALATVAAVAVATWFALPGLQSILERSAASRSAPALADPRPVRRPTVVPVPERHAAPQLKPVRYALLEVDSDPRGALYVDGARIGLTLITRHRLPFGTHRLRVERKGYQAVIETVVVKGTAPVTRRYDLRRRQGR